MSCRERGKAVVRALALIAACWLLAFGPVSSAFARAGGAGGHSSGGGSHGGGGGHSSGGGSYGGSHSGGSSGGSLSGFVTVVIIIVIILVVQAQLKKRGISVGGGGGTDGDGGSGPVTEDAPDGPQTDAASLAAFAAAHPGFDAAAFKQKVRRGFSKIQEAWSAQSLAGVRAFISDGMYQRFATQFRMMALLKQTNKLDNVRLLRVEPAAAREDGEYDVLDVYVEASMHDAFVCELDHGLDMEGDAPFAEYWSFIRKQKAPDPKGDIYDANTCPACSAPLPKDMGEIGTCPYCDALVNSGEYDWVLAEITQQADYGAGAVMAPFASPGLAAAAAQLQRENPDFSVQMIEDKASNAFMQIMTALATRNPAGARRFLSDQAFAQVSALIPLGHVVFNRLYLNESVLLDIRRAEARHVLAVGMTVTLQRVEMQPSGGFVKLDDEEVQRRHVLILERDVAAAVGKGALYQHQCSNCGAPVQDSLDVKCAYCSAALNSTCTEWIVTEFLTDAEYLKRREPR